MWSDRRWKAESEVTDGTLTCTFSHVWHILEYQQSTTFIGKFCLDFNYTFVLFAVPVPYEHDRRPKLMRRAQIRIRAHMANSIRIACKRLNATRTQYCAEKPNANRLDNFCLLNFKTTETCPTKSAAHIYFIHFLFICCYSSIYLSDNLRPHACVGH